MLQKPTNYYIADDKSLLKCRLSARVLLIFVSSRLARGGLRLVLGLGLLVFFLAAALVPQRLSEVALGRHIAPLLQWRPAADSSIDGGGLRMVVFGAPDVATFPGDKSKSWTERLCDEVTNKRFPPVTQANRNRSWNALPTSLLSPKPTWRTQIRFSPPTACTKK